jgi:uncharacterized protein (DUF4415 family)
MNVNSDSIHAQYADMDFSDAKPVSQIPALAALQAVHKTENKTKITIRIDQTTLAQFKAKAADTGNSYQSIMNEALKQYLTAASLQDVVRETIRQELKHG